MKKAEMPCLNEDRRGCKKMSLGKWSKAVIQEAVWETGRSLSPAAGTELHPRPVNLGKHMKVVMVCALVWVHPEPGVKTGLHVLDWGCGSVAAQAARAKY